MWPWEKAKLFCMKFVLHADMLFLQLSAVLYREFNRFSDHVFGRFTHNSPC